MVTELSDFRLKTLWGLCRHNKSDMFSSPSSCQWHLTPHTSHLLLFATHEENDDEQCKNLSAVIVFVMSRKDRWWIKSVRALNAVRRSATSTLPCSWGLVACTQVQLQYGTEVSLLGQTAGKELWETSVGAPTPRLVRCIQASALALACCLTDLWFMHVSAFLHWSQNHLFKTERQLKHCPKDPSTCF